MKKLSIISYLILQIMLLSCQQNSGIEKALFEDREVLVSDDRVAAWAIPNIVSTEKGTLFCFTTARLGDNHDWGNVQEVAMIRSINNGQTWEGPVTIAANPDWTVRQTSAIVVPQTNKIIVFGHKSPRFNADGERISETWNIAHPEERKALGAAQFYIESGDEGKTWSEMQDIDIPYWPHDPGICLKYGDYKGRLILPARTNKGTKFDWNNLYNGVLISDDEGATWRAGGLTQSHVGEACVVELSDGRIYVNSRNHNDNFGIRVHAISADGGETFTEFGDDPQLIEPTCDAGMVRFSSPGDGNCILFCNPAVKASKRWDGSSRRRMSVKASFDDCKTWPLGKLVFEGPSAYSELAVGKNDMIFLVYERARLGSKDSRENIAIARFNMAWLKQDEVEPPQFNTESRIFYKNQEVMLITGSGNSIRYTDDGRDPDNSSKLYSAPFQLTKSTLIRAAAFTPDGVMSIISSAEFICSKFAAPEYAIAYNPKYAASGRYALVDGLTGTLNYNDGRWQGFEENDLDVIVDLGLEREIEQIGVNFLQSTNFWIFFPEWVSFSVSSDGRKFKKLHTIKINPAKKTDDSIRNVSANTKNIKTRYIRIQAKNTAICPEWHKGAGGKAWLFIDEILIK